MQSKADQTDQSLGLAFTFLTGSKSLNNINCRSFLTLLEKFSRFLVEQKLTGTQCRCWSPKAEEWRGPQGSEPQPSVHKPPGYSWCAGRRRKGITKKAGKSSPGNCLVALEDNKPQTVLLRPKLTLHCKDKILLPSGAACPCTQSLSAASLSPCEQHVSVPLETAGPKLRLRAHLCAGG